MSDVAAALARGSGVPRPRGSGGWPRAVPALGLVIFTLGCSPRGAVPRAWERVLPSFVAPVYQLVHDPVEAGVIYCACGWQAQGDGGRMGGVLRSADGGRRWVEASRGLEPGVEVQCLSFAPPGFAGLQRPLLAGTRGAGLYLSGDGGVSWWRVEGRDDELDWPRLSVQAVTTLGDDPATVAIGTRGQGVLVSSDGGEHWELRNEGLLNLTIQALVATTNGEVVAGTWYGGVYRSSDQGRQWHSLSRDLERVALASVAVDGSGAIWVGLQNAGVLVRAPGSTTFAEEDIGPASGLGVLTIHAGDEGVVLGTAGTGAVFGRLGGPYRVVEEGLENQTVSVVLADAADVGSMLIGTWAGLYRAVPPRSPLLAVIAAAALAVVALVSVPILWRRTLTSQVWSLGRRLSGPHLDGLVRTLFEEILTSASGPESEIIFERLARHLARSPGSPRAALAETIRCSAPLGDLVSRVREGGDPELVPLLAVAVEARADALSAVARKIDSQGGDSSLAHLILDQDRLFADFLRAEGLAHLPPLGARLNELMDRSAAIATTANPGPLALESLRQVFTTVEQLGQMPTAEDRALVLGQALHQIIAAQEAVASLLEERQTHGLRAVPIVLDTVRQLITTAMTDLRQRAEIRVELCSKVLLASRETVVVLELENVGRGHAKNITIDLEPEGASFRAMVLHREVKSLLRGQTAQVEFLVEPRVSDRVRLHFRLTFDDLVRQGQTLQFADVVEFRRRPEERTFTPLRPNPYVVGRPLMDSDVFTGRSDVFERIRSSLEGTNQDNVVVLIGQRRMGKTSILKRLSRHIGSAHLVVLIDLQGLLGQGDATFFKELVHAIADELSMHGLEVPLPSQETIAADPGSAFRRELLPAVGSILGERRLLLAFDEFEVLEERIQAGDLSPRLLPYLRSLMQHETGVSFMFAGTHRLNDLTGDYWGVLFNLAVYLEVGHLTRDDVESLLVEPTRDHFEFDSLAVQKVYQLTGGHPHFTQLMARELVDHRNQRQLAYVTVQDVNAVAEIVAEKGQLHIAYLWDGAGRDERLVLLSYKELFDREGLVTVPSIYQFLKERRVRHGDLAEAAARLVRKEIIERSAGLLHFRIDLLRMWIDRHIDLEPFLLSETSGAEP